MNLEKQIYVRKSCRKYNDDKFDVEFIHKFLSSSVMPLNEDIEYSYEILTTDEVKLRTGWSAPFYLSLYSEKKENYKENIGFVFQQLSLYLQSMDVGTCWVGMASPKRKNDDFVILLSFGKSDDMTRDLSGFKRKSLSDISDCNDERLIPAQLAPSAINSQPWFFKKSDEGFDVYQVNQNIFKRKILGRWNPIDMGICLAHLYVSNIDSFDFKIKNNVKKVNGYNYTGSVEI